MSPNSFHLFHFQVTNIILRDLPIQLNRRKSSAKLIIRDSKKGANTIISQNYICLKIWSMLTANAFIPQETMRVNYLYPAPPCIAN